MQKDLQYLYTKGKILVLNRKIDTFSGELEVEMQKTAIALRSISEKQRAVQELCWLRN